MATETRIISLGAAPMQANATGNDAGPDLGEPGRRIRLTNAGDDDLFWLVAAQEPPVGMPGFPIRRGGSHTVSLPSMPLWAWSAGSSRLLVSPLGKAHDRGAIPDATGAVILTPLPVLMPPPPGSRTGTATVLAVNAGGGKAFLYAGGDTLPADPVPTHVLDVGEAFTGYRHEGGDDDASMWCWSDSHGGATLLLTYADSGWEL